MCSINQNILEMVKSIIPGAPTNLINYYIEKATNYFLTVTNQPTVPQNAETIIVELVIIYYNKLGYEGLISSSQGGNTLNFGTDIPQYLKSEINKFINTKWV